MRRPFPHRLILLLALLLMHPAAATLVFPFTSWDDLTEKSPDIIIARCTTTAEPMIITGMVTTDIEVLSVLKGATKPGPAKMASDYRPRQGEHFLLFSTHMQQPDGMRYTATETYRAVPLGLSVPLAELKDQPMESQIQQLLSIRLHQLTQEQEARAEEKRRLEQGWTGRTPGREPDPNERAKWEARVKQITRGMRRAEVEKILPPYHAIFSEGAGLIPYSGGATCLSGGSQSISYYVSPGWLVSIGYDYTGITADKPNQPGRYQSPENRVIGPATLQYLLETPPIKQVQLGGHRGQASGVRGYRLITPEEANKIPFRPPPSAQFPIPS